MKGLLEENQSSLFSRFSFFPIFELIVSGRYCTSGTGFIFIPSLSLLYPFFIPSLSLLYPFFIPSIPRSVIKFHFGTSCVMCLPFDSKNMKPLSCGYEVNY